MGSSSNSINLLSKARLTIGTYCKLFNLVTSNKVCFQDQVNLSPFPTNYTSNTIILFINCRETYFLFRYSFLIFQEKRFNGSFQLLLRFSGIVIHQFLDHHPLLKFSVFLLVISGLLIQKQLLKTIFQVMKQIFIFFLHNNNMTTPNKYLKNMLAIIFCAFLGIVIFRAFTFYMLIQLLLFYVTRSF